MVVVGLDGGSPKWTRSDLQEVGSGLGSGSQPPEFTLQGREAIRLLDAQVRDVADSGRTLREEGHHRQGQDRIGDIVHVDIDPPQPTFGAPDRDRARLAHDPTAHLFQDAEQSEVGLLGVSRDPLDPDFPARDGGGAEAIHRGLRVRLDLEIRTPVAACGHSRTPGVDLQLGTESPHHLRSQF